jgi:hypothetical protein
MFGWFKRRTVDTNPAELSRLAASATAETKDKWIHFHQTVHLAAAVPLAQKIDFFAQPLDEFIRTKYPQLLAGGSEIFWLTLVTAILESGTHPKDEVNAAIAQLQAKYVGRGRH